MVLASSSSTSSSTYCLIWLASIEDQDQSSAINLEVRATRLGLWLQLVALKSRELLPSQWFDIFFINKLKVGDMEMDLIFKTEKKIKKIKNLERFDKVRFVTLDWDDSW